MAYTPRLSAPSPTDPRYVNYQYGGYSYAIAIDTSNGCTMPNCVGYVHGRVMEMNDLYADVPLSTGNGSTFWGNTSDGYSRGSEPQLGAVACYSGGAGHVCIVEEIIDADTIVTSDSDYGGAFFTLRTRTRGNNWLVSGSTLTFQGFVYTYTEEPTPPTELTDEEMYAAYMQRKRRRVIVK